MVRVLSESGLPPPICHLCGRALEVRSQTALAVDLTDRGALIVPLPLVAELLSVLVELLVAVVVVSIGCGRRRTVMANWGIKLLTMSVFALGGLHDGSILVRICP